MIYSGSYLRVLTPRTTNGTNILVDENTGIAQYKEAHLPLTARRKIELLNKSLPAHLRKKIEVISPVVQQPVLQPQSVPVEAAQAQQSIDDVLDQITGTGAQTNIPQQTKQTAPATPAKK